MAYPTSLTLQQIFDLNEKERRRQAMERYPWQFEGLTGPEAAPSQSSMAEMDRLGLQGLVTQGSTHLRGSPEETYPALEGHPYTQTEGWETLGRGDASGARGLYSQGLDEVRMSEKIGSGADIRPGTQLHEPGHRADWILRQNVPESRFEEAGISDFMFPGGEWSPQAAHDRIYSQDPDLAYQLQVRPETDPEKLRDVRREMNIMATELPPEVWGEDLRTGLLAEERPPQLAVREEPEMGLLSAANVGLGRAYDRGNERLGELYDRGNERLGEAYDRGNEWLGGLLSSRTKSGVGGLGAWKQRDWETGPESWGGEGDTFRSFTYPATASGAVEERQPSTLREAQSQNKDYYIQDGERKLAITGDQLSRFKKSVYYEPDSKKSALTQWANIVKTGGLRDQVWKNIKGTEPTKTIEGIKTQKPGNLSGNDKFITNWAKNYYTGEKQDDPKYLAEVESRLKTKVTKEASDAIASAVKIFGTDKRHDGTRMTAELMRKTLEDIGKVESGYRTRIAGGGRPERGFWQVLPSTAKDALKNASGYFGPTFNKTFKDYDWVRDGESPYESLSRMSQKEISKLLESDDKLGAAFAAVQVLRTFDK